MDKNEFRTIQRKLNIILNQIKKDDLNRGIDITSQEYLEALLLLKNKLLEGFKLKPDEYINLKNEYNKKPLKYSELENTPDIFDYNEIKSIARQEAKKVIPAPVYETKIIKEVIKEQPQIIKTIVKETDYEKTRELESNLLELQSANAKIYEEMNNARERLQHILPTDFIEQWKLLTSGGLADSLHQHDVKQRRGYGGVDAQTVISLINQYSGGTNFWQRAGTTLSPLMVGDDISTTGIGIFGECTHSTHAWLTK